MKNEWVIVADGSRAKILKRDGAVLKPVFPTTHIDEINVKIDKDAKKPGATRQALGFGNVYSPHQNYHDLEKEQFMEHVASIVNKNYQDFDKLTLIAPAERLGELRSLLNIQVKNKVTREINKDLTKASLEDVYNYAVALPAA